MMMRLTDVSAFAVAAACLLDGAVAAAVGAEPPDSAAQRCCESLIDRGISSGVHECDAHRLSIVQIESRTGTASSIEAARRRAAAMADQAFLEDAWIREAMSLPELAGLPDDRQQLVARSLLPSRLDGTLEGAWTCARDSVGQGKRGREIVRVVRVMPLDGLVLESRPAAALDSFCEAALRGEASRYGALLALELVDESLVEQHVDQLTSMIQATDCSEVRTILCGRSLRMGPPNPSGQPCSGADVFGIDEFDDVFLELDSSPHDMNAWLRLSKGLAASGWPRASQLVAGRCLQLELDPAARREFMLLVTDDWAKSIADTPPGM